MSGEVSGVVLRIGVTGHRDPDPADLGSLRQDITRLLLELRQRLPGVELELVSGMADGADRLAVDAALDAGLRVHALLPMPLTMYLHDFDAASRADIQSRLADPRIRHTELELPPHVDHDAASVPGAMRDELYAALAERLRRCTSILLALWDGEDTGLPGGTGDTVMRYLGLVIGDGPRAPGRVALDIPPVTSARAQRPVYRFPTGRTSTDRGSPGAAGYLGITEDDVVVPIGEQLPAAVAREFEEIVAYAREAAGRVDPATHRWGLMNEEIAALRPAAADGLRALDEEYRRADLLAIYHQGRSERLFKVFSIMAAIMGLLFLVYAKLAASQWLLAAYLLMFAGGIALVGVAARGQWFTRHLMYRAIAETLRTRFFLTVAGVPARGLEQHLMRLLGIGRIEGFSWIAYVVRGATPFTAGPTGQPGQCLEYVRTTWIEDQHHYFERKAHALHDAGHRLEKIKHLILGGMVSSIVALLIFKAQLADILLLGLPLKTYVVFLLGLVPFWLGVWELYQAKMATKELGWQYRNQLYHLQHAARALRRADDPARAAAVLNDTAERMLTDTYLWTVQRFHRDHEPPAAG